MKISKRLKAESIFAQAVVLIKFFAGKTAREEHAAETAAGVRIPQNNNLKDEYYEEGFIMTKGTIYSISVSPERGQLKKEIPEANFIENFGIEGDGHAGGWGRQITCLGWNSVKNTNAAYQIDAGPGDFAENILIDNIDLSNVKNGSKIHIADGVVLEVTQIGKEDHPSIVSRTFGVSLLPKEGLFCKVLKGGSVRKGDPVSITD